MNPISLVYKYRQIRVLQTAPCSARLGRGWCCRAARGLCWRPGSLLTDWCTECWFPAALQNWDHYWTVLEESEMTRQENPFRITHSREPLNEKMYWHLYFFGLLILVFLLSFLKQTHSARTSGASEAIRITYNGCHPRQCGEGLVRVLLFWLTARTTYTNYSNTHSWHLIC